MFDEKLSTKISITKSCNLISPKDFVYFCGSCFAETIGDLWTSCELPSIVNPTGILFNPLSIAKIINYSLSKETINFDFHEQNNRWFSLDFHSKFSGSTLEEAQKNSQNALVTSRNSIKKSNYIIISWGTAFAWFHESDKFSPVANCHRLPTNQFSRKLITHKEIVDIYSEIIQRLSTQGKKIIISVSPIRHLRQSPNENTISKSHLLIAANELSELFPETVQYFPSFEIMMDELRDYRFYAEDLIHPSPLAKNIIRNKFIQNHTNLDLMKLFNENRNKLANQDHRPRFA